MLFFASPSSNNPTMAAVSSFGHDVLKLFAAGSGAHESGFVHSGHCAGAMAPSATESKSERAFHGSLATTQALTVDQIPCKRHPA